MALFKLTTPKRGLSENSTNAAENRKDTDTSDPEYAGAKIAVPDTNNGIINVVSDYSWTISPKTSRIDVPYISIIERKIINNVALQQLLYNVSAVGNVIGENTKLIDSVTGGNVSELINRLQTKISDTIDKTNKIEKTGNIIPSNPLNPYEGLYDLEDTGWMYILPYLGGENHSIQNQWGEPTGGFVQNLSNSLINATTNVSKNINDIIGGLGKLTGTGSAISNVGTYIEKAKQYQYPSSGPSYNVNFMLYNTTTIEDVIKNWELCFLLLYNMLPNRRTKTVFDPPPLYEISIPGVRKSPISSMESITITFIGSTRLMDLDVIGGTQRTIVPDAYSISIKFTDIFPETKNFMNALIDDDIQINVSSKTTSFTIGENAVTNNSLTATKLNNGITHINLSNGTRLPK